jgi:hypothetical protein
VVWSLEIEGDLDSGEAKKIKFIEDKAFISLVRECVAFSSNLHPSSICENNFSQDFRQKVGSWGIFIF